MADLGDSLRVVCSNERFAIGSWRNIHLVVTRGELRAVDLRYSRQVHANLRARYPDGSGTLSVIELAKSPSSSVRAEAVRSFREEGPLIRCCALVLEDTGFRGTAVRSALSTIFMVARHPCPCCIFKNIEDAVLWTLTRLDADLKGREALHTAIEELRKTPFLPPAGS